MLPEIIPVILTKSTTDLESKIRAVEESVKRVQIDIVDGNFAANLTISPEVLSRLETTLSFDIHLMVKKPLTWIEKCHLALADRLISQVEAVDDQEKFIAQVIESGMAAGLAIGLETKLKELNLEALAACDTVLLLAVETGFGGQEFNRSVLGKIKSLKKIREENNFHFKIGVDGGLNQENIRQVALAGADELIVGGAIFQKKDPARAIEELTKILS